MPLQDLACLVKSWRTCVNEYAAFYLWSCFYQMIRMTFVVNATLQKFALITVLFCWGNLVTFKYFWLFFVVGGCYGGFVVRVFTGG